MKSLFFTYLYFLLKIISDSASLKAGIAYKNIFGDHSLNNYQNLKNLDNSTFEIHATPINNGITDLFLL